MNSLKLLDKAVEQLASLPGVGRKTALKFALNLLRLARERRVKTCIETCGLVPTDVVREAAQYLNYVLFDIKHMDPEVPNYGKRGRGYVLQVGDTICIEPMASLGKPDTLVAKDGWTVILKDGSIGAQFEHTILVTEDGFEVLTKVG